MTAFVVNSLSDSSDPGAGKLTLREAIDQANSTAGDDTISFGTALSGGTIELTQGQLQIDNLSGGDTGSLTINGDIDGDGSADLAVSAQRLSRVFLVKGDGVGDYMSATLQSLVVADGYLQGSSGAGILADNATLAVTGSIVQGNNIVGLDNGNPTAGAGIASLGGSLAVTATSVTANTILSAGSSDSTPDRSYGAGIYKQTGSLTLSNTVVSDNKTYGASTANGGGVFAEAETVSIVNTRITGNGVYSAPENNYNYGHGGGLFIDATTGYIAGSVISGNQQGGIVANGETLIIANTTISDNAQAGGILSAVDDLVIFGSTINGNTTIGEYAKGAGALLVGGSTVIANSTIANNSAYSGSGHGFAAGGGVFASGGELTFLSSTVVNNKASFDFYYQVYVQTGYNYYGPFGYYKGVNVLEYGRGGGIAADNSTPILKNTIVAGNDAAVATNDIGATIVSDGHNLFSQSVVYGAETGDLLGIADPALSPLDGHGGLTQTIALLGGSPAIDAGSTADADGITNDQRGSGYPRFSGGFVDIGSYEVQQTAGASATTLALAYGPGDGANGWLLV